VSCRGAAHSAHCRQGVPGALHSLQGELGMQRTRSGQACMHACMSKTTPLPVRQAVEASALVGNLDDDSEAELDSCSRDCGGDIVVATPGRLVAHLQGTRGFSLANLQFLVGSCCTNRWAFAAGHPHGPCLPARLSFAKLETVAILATPLSTTKLPNLFALCFLMCTFPTSCTYQINDGASCWQIVDEADRLLRQAYQDWLPKVLAAVTPAPDSAADAGQACGCACGRHARGPQPCAACIAGRPASREGCASSGNFKNGQLNCCCAALKAGGSGSSR
jgi:hypothetical protein